jgi:hypothetical protein
MGTSHANLLPMLVFIGWLAALILVLTRGL